VLYSTGLCRRAMSICLDSANPTGYLAFSFPGTSAPGSNSSNRSLELLLLGTLALWPKFQALKVPVLSLLGTLFPRIFIPENYHFPELSLRMYSSCYTIHSIVFVVEEFFSDSVVSIFASRGRAYIATDFVRSFL